MELSQAQFDALTRDEQRAYTRGTYKPAAAEAAETIEEEEEEESSNPTEEEDGEEEPQDSDEDDEGEEPEESEEEGDEPEGDDEQEEEDPDEDPQPIAKGAPKVPPAVVRKERARRIEAQRRASEIERKLAVAEAKLEMLQAGYVQPGVAHKAQTETATTAEEPEEEFPLPTDLPDPAYDRDGYEKALNKHYAKVAEKSAERVLQRTRAREAEEKKAQQDAHNALMQERSKVQSKYKDYDEREAAFMAAVKKFPSLAQDAPTFEDVYQIGKDFLHLIGKSPSAKAPVSKSPPRSKEQRDHPPLPGQAPRSSAASEGRTGAKPYRELSQAEWDKLPEEKLNAYKSLKLP